MKVATASQEEEGAEEKDEGESDVNNKENSPPPRSSRGMRTEEGDRDEDAGVQEAHGQGRGDDEDKEACRGRALRDRAIYEGPPASVRERRLHVRGQEGCEEQGNRCTSAGARHPRES